MYVCLLFVLSQRCLIQSQLQRNRKPKDPSANPKPQSSELVDEVFSLFKRYLNTKLEAQEKKTVSRKYRGPPGNSNSKVRGNNLRLTPSQKVFSPELRLELTTQVRCLTLAQEAQQIVRKRQKLIKIAADRNKDSWLIVQEYESDNLTSNSEDEKRFKKAEIYFLFYYYLPHNNYKKYRKRRKKEVARRPNRNYRSLLEVRSPRTTGQSCFTSIEEKMAKSRRWNNFHTNSIIFSFFLKEERD